ncbi:FAD-dependent oxidoreductase [Nocardioides salarius]|uniref:FAD-dependent oxidoreductase n=1 Tax=Nocardioides salarius TaxID=374513 RepID=UPI003C6E33EF
MDEVDVAARVDVVDVVVVGAGIGGLAAADALVGAGLDVVVLEARPRTGGRLLSTPDGLELGATGGWDGEERVLALARRLGVTTYAQHLSGDTVVEDLHGVQRHPGNLLDVPAHRYTGGAAALTDALAAGLPPGCLLLEHPVRRLASAPGGRLEVEARGRRWHARHVVLALPPSVAVDTVELPAELPAELVRVAGAVPTWVGQVAKVVAVYDTPFWREAGLAGAGASRLGPVQELHDMSGPGGVPAAVLGFAPSALVGDDAEERVRAQLGLTVTDWSSEAWTSPAGAASRPADHSLYGHPLLQAPALGGRLHWPPPRPRGPSPATSRVRCWPPSGPPPRWPGPRRSVVAQSSPATSRPSGVCGSSSIASTAGVRSGSRPGRRRSRCTPAIMQRTEPPASSMVGISTATISQDSSMAATWSSRRLRRARADITMM